MILAMKSLNEESYVERCIGDIHDEPWVEKIIVIDGWSTDYTVQELRKFKKVKVYQHKWENWFHAQEEVQSNILLSYIPVDKIFFILDFDELCSTELKKVLAKIDENGIPDGADIAHVSRKTFECMRYENSPYAIMEKSGFPMTSRQIGAYPDFQCRIIKRSLEHHWINSPHHRLLGWKKNINIQADLIHYEKNNYEDRIRIEKQWARTWARRKELGLAVSVEGYVRPEYHKYTNPRYWNNESD